MNGEEGKEETTEGMEIVMIRKDAEEQEEGRRRSRRRSKLIMKTT